MICFVDGLTIIAKVFFNYTKSEEISLENSCTMKWSACMCFSFNRSSISGKIMKVDLSLSELVHSCCHLRSVCLLTSALVPAIIPFLTEVSNNNLSENEYKDVWLLQRWACQKTLRSRVSWFSWWPWTRTMTRKEASPSPSQRRSTGRLSLSTRTLVQYLTVPTSLKSLVLFTLLTWRDMIILYELQFWLEKSSI